MTKTAVFFLKLGENGNHTLGYMNPKIGFYNPKTASKALLFAVFGVASGVLPGLGVELTAGGVALFAGALALGACACACALSLIHI